MTVVDDAPVRQAALDAGVIDFVDKPIKPRDVRARCRNLLQLRQQSESVKQRALSLEQRLLASMHEVEAVSYPHLDVYKRQLHANC